MAGLHLITAVIDSKQKRNVMTAGIPNSFVKMDIEKKANGRQTIMKIRKQIVHIVNQHITPRLSRFCPK